MLYEFLNAGKDIAVDVVDEVKRGEEGEGEEGAGDDMGAGCRFGGGGHDDGMVAGTGKWSLETNPGGVRRVHLMTVP